MNRNNAQPDRLAGPAERLLQQQNIDAAKIHMLAVRDLSADFGEGRIDPLAYRDRMWQLTGGKTLNQTTAELTGIAERAKTTGSLK